MNQCGTWREYVEGGHIQGQGSCVTLEPQLPGEQVSSVASDGVGGLEGQWESSCWEGKLCKQGEH